MECWSESHSLESWRSYNYPHVTTVYWSLYRAARYATPALATRQGWEWYVYIYIYVYIYVCVCVYDMYV